MATIVSPEKRKNKLKNEEFNVMDLQGDVVVAIS
jgi:hypothetical protein